MTTIAISDGQTVTDGETLYTVDEEPIVVAQGAVPDFEAIGPQTSGVDVAQLQKLLIAEHIYGGQADGTSSMGFENAIKAWQRHIGADPTGIVPEGSIVFVPTLPMKIGVNSSELAVGNTIAPGEKLLSMVATQPTFTLTVSPDQASQIPDHTMVAIRDGNLTWPADSGPQKDGANGDVIIAVTPKDGESICSTNCDRIPIEGTTRLSATITTQPTKEGLIVPSGAIFTDAAGHTIVVTKGGRRVRVKINGAANGLSLISGATAGLVVRFTNVND